MSELGAAGRGGARRGGIASGELFCGRAQSAPLGTASSWLFPGREEEAAAVAWLRKQPELSVLSSSRPRRPPAIGSREEGVEAAPGEPLR